MITIDPWGSAKIESYEKLFESFGIEKFESFAKKLKDPHMLMTRGVVIGQRDYKQIFDAILNKRDYAMMTGFMPSGKFHFGHKMVADQIVWYQNHGAELFVAVADMEAYAVRQMSLEETRKIAIEEYILNYIALGLKPRNLHLWFQSNYKPSYYKLAAMFSRKITMNEFKAIYGELSPGKIQAVLLQIADIMHPQLKEFGGPKPVVVPVGTDQDPHIRITRDVAARFKEDFGFILPSSTYHKFTTGLDSGKMSSSKPESYIALSDGPEIAVNKLKRAFTGGRDTVEEQKKLGGVPEKCVIFELYTQHLIKDDKELENICKDCKSGKLLCSEDKQRACELLKKFLIEHQKKREKARKEIKKFLKE